MTYYTDLFSPETYETFSKSDMNVSGFRQYQLTTAKRLQPGDKFICYMTKFSRWVGVLDILSECHIDDTPLFYEEDDPFVVRFKVSPVVWLERDKTIPIHEDHVWETLSFTRGHDKGSSAWTGMIRSSLKKFDDADGRFLEELILSQIDKQITYPVDEAEFRKYIGQRIRRQDRVVTVSVPEEIEEVEEISDQLEIRDSIRIQALLAQIGERMGYSIWLPRNDRSNVLQAWEPGKDVLLDHLPLNYDEVTLRTIEQIDVLWLKKRSIVRAFEVEHSTSVYSGILRMADLLALQPNMDIKLHIVAPYRRREKVFQELQRPVFSLLDRAPLSEICTFLSYDSLEDLASEKHISYLSDAVIEEYQETVE